MYNYRYYQCVIHLWFCTVFGNNNNNNSYKCGCGVRECTRIEEFKRRVGLGYR